MGKLSIGKNPPSEINALIEIPRGGKVKYELDKESGVIFVDRFLYTAMYFPFNYGFVPETLGQDGDPLDIFVLSSETVVPGVVIPARPIGMLEMEDESGIDTKVIAVPMQKIDPYFGTFEDISDVPTSLKDKIRNFFENYKALEPGKWVKVKEWRGREEALTEIKAAMERKGK